VSEASLVFCAECGNAVHQACFKQCEDHVSRVSLVRRWVTFFLVLGSNHLGKDVTCVYCRARWVFAGPSGSGSGSGAAKRTAEGYLNLGEVAGLSPMRDTSTCAY
jgi:hypothetical protein